jgi:pSer/pThr/pTyr-binding forkhead associated (FHA) protein
MPLLVIQRGPNAGKEFPLDGDALIIGRQPDCAIWLESTAVSRQHAQIVRLEDAYFIETEKRGRSSIKYELRPAL